MTRDEVREQIADILDENLILHSIISIIQGEPVFILKNKLPRIADQILAIPDIAIVEREAKLPAFARVDVEGKPEVGRYYDGYKDGQEDMLEAGWVKEMKK